MIVFDVAIKVLDTETFPLPTITDLNPGITLTVFFQSGEAFTVKGNIYIIYIYIYIYTYIPHHTRKHTHTHTRTHTRIISGRSFNANKI